jgi:hypothetical protein
MVRRRWLIAKLALLGVLALLVFPGSGSALLPQYIVSLTPSGPSPMEMTEPVGFPPVRFRNTDTVTHSVVFANGSCSLDVAAGTEQSCTSQFPIGDYVYSVDGTNEAHLVITAIPRSISLRAHRTTVKRGARLMLHGQLHDIQYPSPPNAGSPQPVMVLALHYHGHKLHRIAVVMAKLLPGTKRDPFGRLVWRLHVRPRATTTYIAEAVYQPRSGRVWKQAWSKPLKIVVRG